MTIQPNNGQATPNTLSLTLGDATDNKINIDGTGGIAISAAITGSSKKLTLGGTGTGTLTLSGNNIYTGDTTISSGKLSLGTAGSISNSANIIIGGGSTFDLSAYSSALSMSSGQGLKGTGTTSTGTITLSGTGARLSTATNSPIQFTAFNGTTAPLTVSAATAASLVLNENNPVTVNTTAALGAGDYTLIAKSGSATVSIVSGIPPTSLTIGGSGLAPNTVGSLLLTNSQLVLHVVAAPSISKSFGTSPINVGGTSLLNIVVTNPNSSTALTGVGFTDTLPTGLTVPDLAPTSQCGGTVSITSNVITLSGATVAAALTCTTSVTVTANGAATGVITNNTSTVTSTNGGTGNSASANITVNVNPATLKYRSRQSGNWNDFNTWEVDSGSGFVNAVSGQTPSSANDTIQIQSHAVTVTASVDADQLSSVAGGTLVVNNGVTFTVADGTGTDFTSAGLLRTAGQITNNGQVIINGTLQIDQGGFPGGGTGTYQYNQTAGNGILLFNNTSGSYGVNNDNYWPTTNGPQTVNVQGAGGITLNVARTVGTLFQYAAGITNANNLTVNGTSQVNNGGFTSGSPTYGASSLLKYNINASYGRNGEWLPNVTSGAGYPANVQLSNNTNLDLPNGSSGVAFQMAGNLTVDSGSTLNLNGSPAMSQPLTVIGSVVNNGTLTLSANAGGGLTVRGDLTNGGTFNSNAATLTFTGAGAQSWTTNGTGAGKNYGAVAISSSNTVTLNGDLSCTALSVTNGTFSQGPTFNVTTGAVTVSSGGTWTDVGSGDITLNGGVSNAGTINFNGGTTSCGETDAVSISSASQQTWSGTGTFNLIDVTLSNQGGTPPPFITVHSGTNGGGNSIKFIFLNACTGGAYTWVGGTPGFVTDWSVGTNWSPTRSTVDPGDILYFSSSAPTVTNVAGAVPGNTETISALHINGSSPTFSAAGANTLLIDAGSGNTGLDITGAAPLTLSGANPLTIKLASGTLGSVDGTFIVTGAAHKLIGQAAAAITFQNNSFFTTSTGFTGNPFGDGSNPANGAAGSIVFASGSTYSHNAGSSPFGLFTSASVATFQTGSIARWFTNSGFQASGRTYANLQIGDASTATVVSDSGTGTFQFDNLTVNSTPTNGSSLTYSGSGAGAIMIQGNITSNGVGSGSLPDVNLTPGSGQITISKAGAILFNNDGSNTRSVNLDGNVNVVSGTTLTLSRVVQLGLINPNSKNLTMFGGSVLNGGATGYVIGSLTKGFGPPTSNTFQVGSANGYAPIDVANTSGTGTLTISTTGSKHGSISGTNALSRYWTIASSGVTQADLTFHYNVGDVVGTEANYKIFKYSAGVFTQFNPSTLDTGAHFATLNGVNSFSDWTLAEPSAVPSLSIDSTASQAELDSGQANMTFTVNLSPASTQTVTVNYSIADGPTNAATGGAACGPGIDYVNTGGSLTFNPTVTSQPINVPICGDTDIEPNEDFTVTLNTPTNALITSGSGTGTITNDDVATPEIDVLGGSGPTSIPDGSITPNATDGTEFGSVNVSSSVSHPFTIANTGTGVLTLSGSPLVQITGTDASQFNVSPQPASSVAASGTANFSIIFQPTSPGLKSATVHILNDDANEGDYDFVIQGTGVATGETDVVVTGGNLVITDSNGGNTDDTLTLSLSGANVRINDPSHTLTCGAGATQVNANTCDVPLSSITGNIQVDTQGGNDQLTLDLGSGDFIPTGGLSYAGGTQTTSDKLVITGGAQGQVTYNYTNANDGSIEMENFGTVSYTGLEPITNSGTATDVIFNLPNAGNVATLSDLGGGTSRLASTGTFEQTDFANPSGSVTINGGTSNDFFGVNALAASYPSLTINGGQGADSVNFNGAITFAANANLDVNLQDDDPTPGIDDVSVAGQLTTSGTGTIDLRASEEIDVNSGGGLQVENGNLTIEANLQTPTTATEHDGVQVNGGTVQSTGTGNISIKGTGGEGAFDVMYGVIVWNAGKVLSTGTGTITVQGTGGNRTGGPPAPPLGTELYGVYVYLAGSEITSASGAITLTGQGGDTNYTGSYGVIVAGGKVQQSGAGALTINGTGGTVTGGSGVFVDSAGFFVVADDAPIPVGGLITSTGTGANAGNISITGSSSATSTGAVQGVRVDAPGTVTTVDGSISIDGTGGTGNQNSYGTSIRGAVTATGTGAISLIGAGGTAATPGLQVHGVNLRGGAVVTVKDGNLTITGTPGSGSTDNAAFNLASAGTATLQVSAGGTGSITVNADSIRISTVNGTINAGSNAVTLRPKTAAVFIDLGSTSDAQPNTLELSDGELDRVTCATLNIGDNNSESITITNNITRTASTNMTLTAGCDIAINSGQINTGGGTLLLDSGPSPDAIRPANSGVDVTASTLSFGSDLAIVINGTTVDTQYTQLNVVGGVNLANVDLALSGTHTPSPGEQFIIVNNDASDAISGTFTGLPEGATIPSFLGSSYSATISYVGGSGNDAVLTVSTPCTPPSTVYVDDNWSAVTPGSDPDGGGPATNFGCDSFATIQGGIDGVTSGGTVNVYAGTYAEQVDVNKPINLLGPNATINPNTGSRVAEAVIIPTTSDPINPGFNGPITVYLSVPGTTMKGFTVDGNNPSLVSGVVYNGSDVDAQFGIYGDGAANLDTVIENNIVQNIGDMSIWLNSFGFGGTRNANSRITANKVDNNLGPFGQGIRISDDAWLDVTNNVLTRVRLGIVAENFSGNVTTHPASVIDGNNITSFRIGIRHNLHYAYANPGFTISNNTVQPYVQSPMPPQVTTPTQYQGIRVESVQQTVAVTVQDNTLTGNRTAMQSGGYTRLEGLELDNASNVSPNIAFIHNDARDFIRGAFNDTPAVPTFTCSNFAFNTTGVHLSTNATNGLTIHTSNITGNGSGIVNLGAATVNAENNYWGNPSGPTAAGNPGGTGDSASTNVDYDPFSASAPVCANVVSYTITASAGPNGSINPSGAVSVAYGASQLFNITPSPGYAVGDVLVDSVSVGAVSSYTFTNVTANHTISATFVLACTPPSTVYVDDNWSAVTLGTDPDGGGPATNFGCDSFATIQGGVDGVQPSGSVIIYAGTYNEDVNVNKLGVSLLGAGAGSVNVIGPIGGSTSTFVISASNVTLAGMTITRAGNNTTDWNNPGLNTAGISIQGTAVSGALIRDNVLSGNRTGIDINNSNGHTVRNNVIDFNRTGLIFRNQTDQMTVIENFITNNWTVGVLFLDGSGGTNSPPNSSLHSTYSNNSISSNWYGQIVDRQTGGSLPPGGQPDIAGPASANFQYTPFLLSGTDTNVETVPGRGTNGFQGVANTVLVSYLNQNGWVFFDDNPGTGTGSGGFELGPATPPIGSGSAFLTVDSQGRHALGVFNYAGTRADDLLDLLYGSYQNNNTNTVVANSLQFDIDYDLNDAATAYAGRLVFEPYLSPSQGAVAQNVWQNWDARGGMWYGTRTTVTVNNVSVPQPCQPNAPCTWTQILSLYPNAGVRNAPGMAVLFKAGGPWAPGFDGNVDNFRLRQNGALITYDFEPGPQLSINDVTQAETNAGTTTFTFNVTLSEASAQTVTVDYSTADDTATAPPDYVAVPTTQLTFNPGETSKPVTVTVNGDTAFETNETFFVNLSNVNANASILDGQGVGTITNDDTAPTISITDVTMAEGNGGTTDFDFVVSLSSPSFQTITVNAATADDTATTANSDYTAVPSTPLTFTPNTTTQHFHVFVNGDTTFEATEQFFVNLSGPTNATIADAQGVGTITNDDACATFNTVYVDDSWVGTTPGTDPDGGGPATSFTCDSFATIQAAVTAVNSGGTVIVRDGTYTENVTANKPVVLQGPQFGFDARGRVASEAIWSPAVSSTGTLILNVTMTTAVVDGFTFTGGTSLGVIQTQAGADFSNLQIRNNRFSGYSQSAVFMNRGGNDITIDKNVMDGSSISGSGQAIFGNGPQNFNGLWITNNNIINNTGRYGFFVDGNHNVGESATRAALISGNLFDGNVQGLNLGSRSFGKQGTPTLGTYAGTISNNTFSNHPFDGVQAGVQHVLISGNTFSNNGRNGLSLTSFGNTGADRGAQNSTIVSNTLTNNGSGVNGPGAGIFFSGGQAVGTIETNEAHFNRIIGNNVGIQYGNSVAAGNNATINVENNWWGCNFGPGATGAGCSGTTNGTLVFAGNTGTLDSNPWIVLNTTASPNPTTPGGTSTVTADMTKNSDNLTPSGTTFVPPVGVNFTATNGTMAPPSGTITSGQAQSTFTSTSTSAGSACSTVDGQQICTAINITLPSFSIDDVTMSEGNAGTTAFIFTVTKTGATTFSSSVNFTTVDGSAKDDNPPSEDNDYVANSGMLTFGPADTTMQITVLVNGDTKFEGDENFTVQLSSPSGATISDASGTGTIQNDDACAPQATVYVDDSWVGTAPGDDPDGGAGPAMSFGCDSFATIQEGINAVTTGGTVIVYAGAYPENVLVNKSVTVNGPNAGIDPNTGSRVAEAVVLPAVTETSLQASTSGTIFRVGNGSGHVNATIDGFTIDGHNAALTNGRTLNGVEVHTGAGVVNSTGSFDTNPGAYDTTMIVTNNIIRNLERYGVLVDNTPSRPAVTGNDVSHNKIDNLPSGNNFGGGRGRGIAFEENAYGIASFNVITRVNVGWQDDNYNLASPGAATQVLNNTISTYHRGIFHNLQYQSASDATISNNSISVETTGDFAASTTNFGIELASIQSGVGAVVTNNNSTNNVYGILLWNLPTTADITVTGGTLSGNQYGVYATSNDPQFGAGSASHSIISGVTITGATVAGIGIDDGTNVAITALGISGGTSVTGGPLGLLMNGPGARVYNNNLNNTSFTGATNYIALTNGASAGIEINGTGVSFDGLTGATATLAQNYAIEDKIIHAIDDGTVGFVRVKAGNVFVTPNSFTPATLTPNIQRAVNAAVAADTLHAAAGLYPNNVNVNKALNLEGANAGVPGAGVRGAESIIRTNGNQLAVVAVTGASNVTLNGFYLDGDDPLVTGGPLFSGDDANVQYAVRPTGVVSNLTMTNNIATKVAIGIRGDTNPGQGNVISNNWFDSIGNFDFGYSVSIRNNFYADITNNKMTRTWTGVHINNHNGAGGPATFTISGNAIHSYAGGILYWLQFNGATGATINNNQMTAEPSAVANNFGVLMVSIQNAVNPTFTNNTMTGHNYGVGLFNVPTTNTITLGATNAIANSSLAGVFLTDNLNFNPVGTTNFLAGGPGAASTVNVTGMSITGNTGDGLKVEGQTNTQNLVANGNTITGASGTNGAEVIGGFGSANLTANNITGFATGLAFVNNTVATQAMTGSFNRIISGTNAFTATGTGVFNNTVENNWWGCNAGPGNTGCGAATGTGIDFNPWIVLKVSASPNPINPGGNSTVTADMTFNSNNVSPPGVTTLPLPTAAFTATNGTMAPPTNSFTGGLSSSTFTSTSTLDSNACVTVDNQQTCTTIDVSAPQFSIDDVTHFEGNAGTTTYTFTVTKTGTTPFSSSVQFQTADNTATLADNDYQSNSGTLNFGPTDTSMQVTVLVNGDVNFELNDTFFVNLLNPVGGEISDAQGVGTITNDDPAPALSINDRTLNEGTSPGTTSFTFTVTKTGPTNVAATVNFATANGTTNPATGGASCATPGVDYISQTGMLTFPATGLGSTTQTITVQVCKESLYEANETFFVNLSGEVNATISDSQGVGTITNDDSPGDSVEVNTTDDVNDGICDVTHCSLREAILAANSSPSPLGINFNIPPTDPRHFYYKDDGVANQVTYDVTHVIVTTAVNDAALPADKDPDWPHGWWSILPTSQLPTAIQETLFEGYSQPEAVANTASTGTNAVIKIELEGTSAGIGTNGLSVNSGTSVVRGFAINRFNGNGLQISCAVTGNFVGTDVSGTLDLGNTGSGVAVGNNNLVGGSTPDFVNLISGNDADGILISNGNSNTVRGNLIGTKANGTSALPNTGNGVNLTGGGTVFNTIGGINPGEGNMIAFNGADGIQVDTAGISNTIRGNSISANGATNLHLGIDLGTDGVTPNDNQDPDSGPNNLQNFPIITSALKTGSTNTITGTLNSTPSQAFNIDFYGNTSCDASGNGEGAVYLGSMTTGTTDGSGNVGFTFHPATMNVGQSITATATSTTGNTSEFSQCFTVTTGTAGVVEFVSAGYNVNENAGPAQITFKRTGGTDGSISATFNTSTGGTADGSDYTPTSQVVTFADGDTAIKTVNVPITDDSTFEGNETVNLCLSATTINVSGCTGTTAVLNIIDNDTVNISARDARVAEPVSGTDQMVFAVSLDSAPAIPVSVNYATADDTGGANPATSGATCNGATDYQPTSGTLNFAAGERIKTVSVNVCSDTASPENDETLLLNLSGNTPAGTVLARAQAVGTITQANPAGAFLISELRTSGPAGLGDDYVELYNNTDSPVTIAASDATGGYGLFKMGADCNATPELIGTIPNGTVIPARGHYLFVGSQYSLANYGGTGAAAGDATLTQDIDSDHNVAIFSTTDINKLATVTRLDAVGFDGNTGGGVCDLLREGTTLPPVSGSTTEHSFFRKECDFVAAVGCTVAGTPKDTNSNSDDLMFADTQGTFISGVPQRLGAPGPENLASPLFRAATVNVTLIDNTKAQSVVPNRVRDLTSNPGNNSTFGTIAVRRRVVNNTGGNVTRLRFRIVELTTFPSPAAGTADLRALTIAGPIMVSGINDPGTCGVNPTPCTVQVEGTNLEMPPAQTSGGGLNSTVSAGTVSTGTPLLPGQSINVNFLLGVQATGNFRFLIIVEALP